MKAYVGTKIIMAERMYEAQFAADQKRPEPVTNRPGYKVIYPDGYVSWSPKDTFEGAYREITQAEKDIMIRPEGA